MNKKKQQSRVFYKIDEWLMQSVAKAKLNRKLTEKEIKRLASGTINNHKFLSLVYELTHNMVRYITDEGSGEWSNWDKKYENMSFEDIEKIEGEIEGERWEEK